MSPGYECIILVARWKKHLNYFAKHKSNVFSAHLNRRHTM